MASKRHFIILIQGITPAAVRDRFTRANTPHETRTVQQSSAQQGNALIDRANYTLLPHTFVSADKHPKTTNLLCWHCSLPFSRVPRFIALDCARVRSETEQDAYEWVIDGNFCSWACAAAYIDDNYRDSTKRWALQQNLATVRAQIDKKPVRPIERAPARISMRAYSGLSTGMTQQEFADRVESLTASVQH